MVLTSIELLFRTSLHVPSDWFSAMCYFVPRIDARAMKTEEGGVGTQWPTTIYVNTK